MWPRSADAILGYGPPARGSAIESSPMTTIYRYDEIDRFLVFVEQLQVAHELLADSTVAKGRTALVTIDNLAHLLLHRHAKAIFAAGEASRWARHKRYAKKEQRKILGDFNRMVNLAMQESDAPSWRSTQRILDDSDATVLRVGHTYRNNAYHEDRHNPALLPLLAVLYAHAVGRAFVRYHEGMGRHSIEPERAEEVAAYGYDPPADSLMRSTRMFDFEDAAQTITRRLAGMTTVDENGLREWLADDIVARSDRCGRLMAAVVSDGMDLERVEWIFFWSQFWAEHAADERWLELEDERDELAARLPARGDRELSEEDRAILADHQWASEAYAERAHELQRGFKPTVKIADASRLARIGEALRTARDVPSLLTRYEQLDLKVENLERAVGEVVSAHAALVDAAVDIALER